MKRGGQNADLTGECAIKTRCQAALFDIRKNLEQGVVNNVFESSAAVRAHPAVPTLNIEILIRSDDAVWSKIIDPMQHRSFMQRGVWSGARRGHTNDIMAVLS